MPDPATSEISEASLEGRLTDFSTRLSPMLVKELRQGMRTNLFVIAFILLQTFMILVLLAGLADPGSNDANGFFWFFIIATLLVIQPLRGFNALSSEYALNTMDLIQLTRLNGWRITLGKWTALNAQGLLFITGVLPYLVIRYFLGNVNVIADLIALGAVALGSALGTAITIGCSVFRNIVLRGVILVGLAVLFIALATTIQYRVFGRWGGGGSNFLFGGLIALAALYGVFFFLAFGASRIAPLSENHATRKRLVALAFAGASLVFYFFGLEEEVLVVTGSILAAATIDAITEPLPVFNRVLAPFRRNALAGFFAIFFSPGWISGLAFFILASALWMGGFLYADFHTGNEFLEDMIQLLSSCNIIVFPLLIIHLFFPRHGSHHFTFGLYTFIQAGIFVTTLLVMAIANAMHRWEELVYLLVPLPSVFLIASEQGDADTRLHYIIAVATFLVCIGFPLLRHHRTAREFLSALKQRP